MKANIQSVNFDSLETQRDVSKEFFGVNNFVALAAEMEGFRGDLHKDPKSRIEYWLWLQYYQESICFPKHCKKDFKIYRYVRYKFKI